MILLANSDQWRSKRSTFTAYSHLQLFQWEFRQWISIPIRMIFFNELFTFDWATSNVRTALVCVPWTWRQQQVKCIDHHKSVSSWSECISSVRLRITMGFISCSHSPVQLEPWGGGGGRKRPGRGEARAPPYFDRSVNSISTRGQIMRFVYVVW